MKILIISHEYPPIGGGGANACMYLSREYARAGHEVHIVTVWYKGTPEYEETTEFDVPIHISRLKAKRNNKEHCGFAEMLDFLIKADKYANRLVREALSQKDPYDICQVFFGIPSGPVGYHLKRKYGLPYVIRFGGGDIPGFQERFTKVYKLIAPAIRFIWKKADALVANSEGLRSLALQFCDSYPVKVFTNGVDTDVFATEGDKTYSSDEINLLFVSRLIKRKGLQYLIPHLRDIETDTGKHIKLTIVGDGPYRKTLEELAADNDASDITVFAGQKDKSQLLPFYRSGDIFVFPSVKEGMPNAVLEAMACALPIVMSPCQGSDELIDGNGVVSDTDLKNFYKATETVVSKTSEELVKMSLCSRQRAVNLFSWKSVADKYLELFSDIAVKGVADV